MVYTNNSTYQNSLRITHCLQRKPFYLLAALKPSSFLFRITFPNNFSMSPALHPDFSGQRKPPPSFSSTLILFIVYLYHISLLKIICEAIYVVLFLVVHSLFYLQTAMSCQWNVLTCDEEFREFDK